MKYFTLLIFTLLSGNIFAQYFEESPKREFRGVWVATVANIDYPKRPTPNRIAHQEQWKNLLDKMKSVGINTVIAQIRPAGDAFYPSDLAPWSAFLTGKQGKAPQPKYDPLKFMVAEAHKRSMEFHAWFNPYRATTNLDTLNLSPDHAFYKRRQWMVKYGNRYYFNPASEDVKQYLIQVVAEVVTKYDIDAVHFDDYFYPYPVMGEVFPDSTDFLENRGRFSSIENWRRNNVDDFVQKVSSSIKSIKPHVKLGISPFGVWSNQSDKNRMGSNTRASITSYDNLYADILKWLRMGWIDYVIPQLYWNIGFEPADHETLLNWWAANSSGKHLYIGHGVYKVGDNPQIAWDEPSEIPNQIKLNRRNINALGGAYFSAFSLIRNRLGVRDSIRHYYRKPALIPEMEEMTGRVPAPPRLKKIRKKKGNPKLVWKAGKKDIQSKNLPFYYVVYRFKDDKAGSIDGEYENPILTITAFGNKKRKVKFVDHSADPEEFYTYVVTALNRQHNESQASESRVIYKSESGLSRVK